MQNITMVLDAGTADATEAFQEPCGTAEIDASAAGGDALYEV